MQDVSKHVFLIAVLATMFALAPGYAAAFTPAQDDADAEDEDSGDDAEESDGDADAEEADAEEEAEEVETSLFTADEEVADSAEPEPEPSDEPRVLQGTFTKKVWFSSDDGWFKFNPRGWVQPRFTLHIDPDRNDLDAGALNTGEPLAESGFTLRRARFGFQAKMFNIARVYLDTGFSKGAGQLIDYFIDVDPWDGVAALRVGYFRPWFGHQLLMGTTSLQMIDYARAWTDPSLGLAMGRDLGFGIFGMVSDVLEYGVGVWNGEAGAMTTLADGTTVGPHTIPSNIDYSVGGRIAVHSLSKAGGRTLMLGNESDIAVSDKPGLVVGVAAIYNKRHNRIAVMDPADPDDDRLYYDNQFKLGVDAGFQFKGLSVNAEFFLHKVWVNSGTDSVTKDYVELYYIDPGGTLASGMGMGAYAQIGYFIQSAKTEVAVRFDMVDESMDLQGGRFYPALGATYYIFGNNLKAQLMYRINASTGYDNIDPGYIPLSHDISLMLQASI